MYPLKLKPVFKDYIWGGHNLHDQFNMQCNEYTAEAWLLSCHQNGISLIENKSFENMPLIEFINKNKWVTGYKCNDEFPVIVKLIDAQDNLSVQVHPTGKDCKNEMWYIVDCEENSQILYGLKEDISKKEFEKNIKNNTITEIMNKVPVHKGDVFHINAGTLHAIGKGIIVAEIQQSSDVTYRVYDYNRKDKSGNSRQLHIKEALEVMDFKCPTEIYHKTYTKDNIKILNECEFFKVYEISTEDEYLISNDKSSFSHIMIMEGSGVISDYSKVYAENFKKGESFFLSSGCDYIIKGKSKIILTKV